MSLTVPTKEFYLPFSFEDQRKYREDMILKQSAAQTYH